MAETGTRLDSAPLALISAVARFLESHEILNLWACGSKPLNTNMGERGGVTELRLDVLKKNVTAVRYPHFISRFSQLEVLSIRLPQKVILDPKWSQFIKFWPRTIQELYLNFDGLFPAIDMLKLSAYLPILEELTLKSTDSFECNFFKGLPESLASLSLDTDAIIPNPTKMVKSLPRQLAVFKCARYLYDVEKLTPHLPPNLFSLHLISTAYDKQSIKLLPPNLTELSMSCRGDFKSLRWLSNLPQGLVDFNLDGTVVKPVSFDCAILPPGLETLRIDFAVRKVKFETLPRSITSLWLSDVTFSSTTDLCQLPPNLRTLVFWESRPKTVVEGAAALSTAQLPRSLTFLNLGYSECWNSLITNDSAINLPPNLQTLRHFTNDGSLTAESFAKLPRYLRELRLEIPTEFDDACIGDLPRTLTDLELAQCKCLGDVCVPLLPRGLRKFSVRSGKLFTTACIPHVPLSMDPYDFDVKYKVIRALKEYREQ